MKKLIILALISGIAFSAHAQRTISFVSSSGNAGEKTSPQKGIVLKPVDIIASRIYKAPEIRISSLAELRKNTGGYSDTKEVLSAPYDFSDTAKTDTAKVIRKTDTTEIKVGKTRIIVIGEPKIDRIYVDSIEVDEMEDDDNNDDDNDKMQTDHLGMDLGFLYTKGGNSPTEALHTLKQQLEIDNGKSIQFTVYLFNTRVSLYRSYVNLIYGLGLQFNNYHFRKDITVVPNTDSFAVINESIEFSKNKLLSKYVTLPLMLQVQTKELHKNNRLRIGGGVEFAYFINGRSKQVSDERGKVKVSDDFNFRKLKYDLVARVGYGNFSVFAKLPVNDQQFEMFEEGHVPGLTSMSFGVALMGF